VHVCLLRDVRLRVVDLLAKSQHFVLLFLSLLHVEVFRNDLVLEILARLLRPHDLVGLGLIALHWFKRYVDERPTHLDDPRLIRLELNSILNLDKRAEF